MSPMHAGKTTQADHYIYANHAMPPQHSLRVQMCLYPCPVVVNLFASMRPRKQPHHLVDGALFQSMRSRLSSRVRMRGGAA